MFWVVLSGADGFEWACDLSLNAETMTCDVMLKAKTMTCDLMPAAQTVTCELGRLGSFPTEKGNTSEVLKKAHLYRHFPLSL
jgi:hypothetical protein